VFAEIGAATIEFRASDGGSNSQTWMQIVADVIQKPLQLSVQHPGSCLGAAWTAAIGVGLADDWGAITGLAGLGRRVEPNPANGQAYSDGYASFREFYLRMKDFDYGGHS